MARPRNGWLSIHDGVDPWIGRVLDGRYVVMNMVGKGAMSTVYRVLSRAITREFAVKIINIEGGAAGLSSDQLRARLRREIDAIARLRNPHVVPFYEVIELRGGYVGIVMDHVEGTTLEDAVRLHGPLEIERALKILRQVANGLHEAHEFGMIHRDLKPENLMLERLPIGDDFVHVLDFGIVQLDDGIAMTHGFLGTPLYASPEQATGSALDRRSDIYSLGAVLFYLLTGRAPFQSNNVYEILRAHTRTAPPTLADVLGYAMPAPIEALVATMLAKNPEDRPASLAEVIRTVDTLIAEGHRADIEPTPDSRDMVPLPPEATTGEVVGLEESSGSMFESNERDRTGPKAAILRRRRRSDTLTALARDRSRESGAFDEVCKSTTGARPIDLTLEGDLVAGASSSEGSLAICTTASFARIDGKEISNLADVRGLLAVAVSSHSVLATTDAGEVVRVFGDAHERLFQDARRVPMTAVAADLDDTWWLAGSASGRVYRCRADGDRSVWSRIVDGPGVVALASTSNGSHFAIARAHGEVECYNHARPNIPYARFSVKANIRAIALGEHGRLAVVLFEDNSVSVILADTGTTVYKMRDEQNDIFAIGFVDRRDEDSENSAQKGETLVGYFTNGHRLYARSLDRVEALAP